MSFKLIRAALMALLTCLGISAQAVEYHGFVKDPYYLVKGGKVVSPKDFAADPLRYLRTNAAYLALRDHASQVVGKPMNDQAFRQLLVSDDVKMVDCVGRIKTQGVTDDGKIGWHERDCYKGERVMRVKVPGGWMNLLSTGCYNPVDGVRPLAPIPPAPVAGICGDNAQHYAVGTTRFPSELVPAFCKAGSLDKVPDFGDGRWMCKGDHGGSSQQCVATVAVAPVVVTLPPVVVAPKCVEVKRRYVVPQPGQTIVVPGLTVAMCNGVVAIPDTFVNIPWGVSISTRFETECK